jgi:hypothetical protein
VTDIVDEILSVANKFGKPWEWEPDHPQYIEGALYLTPRQWDALCAASPDYDREKWATRPTRAWGIPVQVIAPNERVTLPSGNALVYVLEAFYVFDKTIARDAGLGNAP